MLGITQICDQYAWLYQDKIPEPVGTWDVVMPVDGCYSALKRVDGVSYRMFRGSTTPLDWLEDFKDCAIPFDDQTLGPVHPGVREAVFDLVPALEADDGANVVIVGHSLGAMHAALYAGYRVAAGLPVAALVMFGEPRTGGPQLSKLLAGVDVRSYRGANDQGHDLVTDVARALPPLLPYQHVRDPLTDCRVDPDPLDPWLAFRYHHFGGYCHAFGCGGAAALTLKGARP